MTEKQFYYAHGAVWCTKKPNGLNAISINDLDNGLRVANWLNELNDENEQLKQTVSDWSGSYDELFEDVKRLEEENEQLRKENKELHFIIQQDNFAKQEGFE